MRFAIETDTGAQIRGWLVSDAASPPGTLRLKIPDREDVKIKADLPRPDLVVQGFSPAPSVGFVVDNSAVAGLDLIPDLEIFHAESDAPLYRRLFAPDKLERKLVIFDNAAAPHRRLGSDLSKHFSVTCLNVERFSPETFASILLNPALRSAAFHGRPHLAMMPDLLDQPGIVRAALLRDPYEELAERLLLLGVLANSENEALIGRFAVGLDPLLALAKHTQLDDYKALLGAFRRLSEAQRRAIENPMVRLLGHRGDGSTTHDDLSHALETLAGLDVVGTIGMQTAFELMLAQFLGAGTLQVARPEPSEQTKILAGHLSRIGAVVDLLALDVELCEEVGEAVEESLRTRPTIEDS